MCILQGTKNYGHDMKTRHNQKQCRNRLISCVPVYTHMYTFYVKYMQIILNIFTYANMVSNR